MNSNTIYDTSFYNHTEILKLKEWEEFNKWKQSKVQKKKKKDLPKPYLKR